MYKFAGRLVSNGTSRHRWWNIAIIPAAYLLLNNTTRRITPVFLTPGIPGAVHFFSFFYQQSSCKTS